MSVSVDNGTRIRVDWRASVALVGVVVRYLSVALALAAALFYGGDRLVPIAGVGARYGADQLTFAVTMVPALVVGTALARLDPAPDIGPREGFLMVGLTWLTVSLIGAVPYLIAANGLPGVAPTAPNSVLGAPIDALFESMIRRGPV